MRSIFDPLWIRDLGHLDFIRYWGYDWQGAIYQRLLKMHRQKEIPFYMQE